MPYINKIVIHLKDIVDKEVAYKGHIIDDHARIPYGPYHSVSGKFMPQTYIGIDIGKIYGKEHVMSKEIKILPYIIHIPVKDGMLGIVLDIGPPEITQGG